MSQFSIRLGGGGGGGGLDVLVVFAVGSGNFDVVGSASSAEGAVELAERTRPDILLLDDDALADTESVARRVRAAAPDTRVVVLSASDAAVRAPRLLASGAHGVLDCTIRTERLLGEVRALVSDAASGVAARMEAKPENARWARRLAENVTGTWGADGGPALTLLVSELVGNSIRHGDSDIYVVISLLPEAVRVEVEDRSPRPPVRRPHDDDGESGRGLGIVDALASAWGVEPVAAGKVVWFELAR